MDYKRIYEEFIEHRKILPKLEGVYYERHHIVARCMGGGDEPENLIDLTAEDHYMAHKIMAYAFGGSLWLALSAMSMDRYGNRVGRRDFGRLRSELSKLMSERMASKTLYEFKDLLTGDVFSCTLSELRKRYKLPMHQTQALVSGHSAVVYGRIAFSNTEIRKRRGWMVEEEKHYFRNITTGEVYFVTRRELSEMTGVDPDIFLDLLKGRSKTAKGYCLDITTDLRRSDAGSTVYSFRIIETGEVLHKTARQLRDEWGLTKGGLKGLISGRYKRYKGFCMDSTPTDDPIFNRQPRGSVYTLRNNDNGMLYKGTTRELADMCGFEQSAVSRLVVGRSESIKGYELVKQPPQEEEVAFSSVTVCPEPSKSLQELLQAPSQLR